MAVCVLPGTEIAFERTVVYEPASLIFGSRNLRQTLARFRQVDVDQAYSHHDALEFPDGQVVLLTRILEGQCATVLQLPASPHLHELREHAAEPQAVQPVR
jgi:hypothetical protein